MVGGEDEFIEVDESGKAKQTEEKVKSKPKQKVTIKKKASSRSADTKVKKQVREDAKTDITNIDGIGPKSADAFAKIGITTIEQLLEQCTSDDARAKIAEETGLSEKSIESWVTQAKSS